jgi:Fur family transcriptional regulator, ferric uptake regulator
MQEAIRTLLDDHDLRKTNCREDVLGLFLEKNHALAHSDIEQTLSDQFDRVTIYRTLKSFTDKGLIHKVLDDEGVTKYALCKTHCSSHEHHDEHVHFKCIRCGLTNCLDDVTIPKLKLPSGYKALETNLLVQGICIACSS